MKDPGQYIGYALFVILLVVVLYFFFKSLGWLP